MFIFAAASPDCLPQKSGEAKPKQLRLQSSFFLHSINPVEDSFQYQNVQECKLWI